ncbi:DNA polymerase III subunit gamma/tau [Xanthomonadaceae bacterium XH05]|nr:DNA polymerase III subunit gamma/tau [Xanthomonadaceae bacterium XH05]
MSYLVLARKWRPRRFSELVGQEHVVRALSNALESGRVHHAFLFTGTRGVGKTTIARIFAKSLNCVEGVGAEPCGKCEICQSVDQGRFVDLLEIDAASNTGVDDVREVIENAQYLPTRGRYKVYLIDEVHMLSKSAFNALLKTLEEPPEHVKFLLATTDPQKLPVTVLSRCLQFNLRRLTEEQIAGQMRRILDAEAIPAEDAAIAQLAHAADGSLRDGLSLLDQALAFGGGALNDTDVRSMLGSVDRAQIAGLLDALAAGDGARLMQVATHIAGFSPDFSAVLDALAYALHRVQLRQLVPGAPAQAEGIDAESLATSLAPETVQLWYQMAVLGRRDIDYAPSAQVGFEMTLLRMLAFQPVGSGVAPRAPDAGVAASSVVTPAPAKPVAPLSHLVPARSETPMAAPAAVPVATQPLAPAGPVPELRDPPSSHHVREPAPVVPVAAAVAISDNETWLNALQRCAAVGPVRELGANLRFIGVTDARIQVYLPPALDYLRSDSLVRQLCDALGKVLGIEPRLEFMAAPAATAAETLGDRARREAQAREDGARQAFAEDPVVRGFVAEGAQIRIESVRPRESH